MKFSNLELLYQQEPPGTPCIKDSSEGGFQASPYTKLSISVFLLCLDNSDFCYKSWILVLSNKCVADFPCEQFYSNLLSFLAFSSFFNGGYSSSKALSGMSLFEESRLTVQTLYAMIHRQEHIYSPLFRSHPFNWNIWLQVAFGEIISITVLLFFSVWTE